MMEETKAVIDDLRYDEKSDEYSLVFKGKEHFNGFCNRIQYLNDLIDFLEKENQELRRKI